MTIKELRMRASKNGYAIYLPILIYKEDKEVRIRHLYINPINMKKVDVSERLYMVNLETGKETIL